MADVHTPAQRSFNMSQIRGRDTKPEMLVRRGLHALGLRYRLHDRKLPGRPDLVFPRHRAAIFVHGCFWHAHDCSLSKLPETRTDFWRSKLAANSARDQQIIGMLRSEGWRVLIIWECALRGRGKRTLTDVLAQASQFITQSKSAIRNIEATRCKQ
nr:very short patch repair endonuclease [Dyella sp. ASV24]